MKNLLAYLFAITILMQPVAAIAVDYLDFDSHCQTLWKNESELIQKDVEEGFLTEAEAKEEIDFDSTMVEECVCFYNKVLEGAGEDVVLYLQKADIIQMDEDYTFEEVRELGVPKYPAGLDIDALLEESAKACGIDLE